MPAQELDLDPVDFLTIDAIGKPGQRVFYLQARGAEQTATFILEKVQVQSLALGVEQFLNELHERLPDLPLESGQFDEDQMRILPPVDPWFRVGELGLAYDSDRDRVGLVVREVMTEESDPEESNSARLWCTREQLLAATHWGLEVVNRGRPICPYCGQPMEPEGHFCPKRNGHKH